MNTLVESKKCFISYFDLLGYKNFIMRDHDEEGYVKKKIGHFLRNAEHSISHGKLEETPYGYIADVEYCKTNFINISDTFIFWTTDDSLDSFIDILDVTFNFNWRMNRFDFPIRGTMVHGEMGILNYDRELKSQKIHKVSTIFGKGLIDAHDKGENLYFAGCTLDNTVIDHLNTLGADLNKIIGNKARYTLPYFKAQTDQKQYVFNLFDQETIKQEAFDNVCKSIERVFTEDKDLPDGAKVKLENTIKLLEETVE